ncbi:MAG: sugar ABC transporter substrate-binding protein [Intestinibacillus sp.]
MKKKLLALGLAGMMMLGALVGCGGSGDTGGTDAGNTDAGASTDGGASASGKLKIGMALPARDQFQSDAEKAATKLAESEGVDFKAFDANNDISAQISQVQTCATDGYDAMIVALVNNDSAAEIIQAAGDMPIVFYNRMPTDLTLLNENHVYIGMDEAEAGKAQGVYLAEMLKAENKTDVSGVLLRGPLGQDSVTKRSDGVKAALKDAGINVTWVYEDTAEWDRAKAMDKFTQFMGSGKAYDFVVCNNDDMALGVAEAMNTAAGKITAPIVGIDATENGCNGVKDGSLAATVNQDPNVQGEGSLKLAIELAKGEKPSEVNDQFVQFAAPDTVTKDNVDQFLANFAK